MLRVITTVIPIYQNGRCATGILTKTKEQQLRSVVRELCASGCTYNRSVLQEIVTIDNIVRGVVPIFKFGGPS